MVVNTNNPSTVQAEARGSQFEASMGYIARPCLYRKIKKDN
jgi:hypothetical protein